ncbi:Mariner Mos1 transposase, partial [Acromyrmex echinatior]
LILLHDNARPHVAKPVKKYLERVKWEILPHPLYSPDIAPSDFHLFRSMQSALSGERFNSYEGIKKWLDEWIASKEPDFFHARNPFITGKMGESCRFLRSIL